MFFIGVIQNKIDLNYIKKLSGDTEVIANPPLDGSETALSGLQIDGVKYAMGGKYMHYISMQISNSSGKDLGQISFTVVLPNSKPLTKNTVIEAVFNNYGDAPIQASGAYYSGSGFQGAIFQIYAGSSIVFFKHLNADHTAYQVGTLEVQNARNFVDKVIEV